MAKKKTEQPIIQENIIFGPLDQLMGDKFAIYAKDVIQDRAIPDARDGLKPVQRRIVYDMWNTGNTIDKPTKKCARIVGDVLGKYHPHGDSSVYDALVHMSQDWNVRYPLIDFQGNNGSMDGDSAAVYRYTEVRLSAISNELIADIDKDTVDMELTFDDTLFEPTVLPAQFPNLLANGSEGIAVGISTSIPPHNLREITSAIVHRIKHPDCLVDDLMKYVPGPDFPTGGSREYKGHRFACRCSCELIHGNNGSEFRALFQIVHFYRLSIQRLPFYGDLHPRCLGLDYFVDIGTLANGKVRINNRGALI